MVSGDFVIWIVGNLDQLGPTLVFGHELGFVLSQISLPCLNRFHSPFPGQLFENRNPWSCYLTILVMGQSWVNLTFGHFFHVFQLASSPFERKDENHKVFQPASLKQQNTTGMNFALYKVIIRLYSSLCI